MGECVAKTKIVAIRRQIDIRLRTFGLAVLAQERRVADDTGSGTLKMTYSTHICATMSTRASPKGAGGLRSSDLPGNLTGCM